MQGFGTLLKGSSRESEFPSGDSGLGWLEPLGHRERVCRVLAWRGRVMRRRSVETVSSAESKLVAVTAVIEGVECVYELVARRGS